MLPARILFSAYGGGFDAPALFGRILFAELTRLEGACGAKQVIKRHAAESHLLPLPGGEVTPDDF